MPERSWLRGWMDENKEQIENDLRAAARQVLLGRLTKEQTQFLGAVRRAGGVAFHAKSVDEAEKGLKCP